MHLCVRVCVCATVSVYACYVYVYAHAHRGVREGALPSGLWVYVTVEAFNFHALSEIFHLTH